MLLSIDNSRARTARASIIGSKVLRIGSYWGVYYTKYNIQKKGHEFKNSYHQRSSLGWVHEKERID